MMVWDPTESVWPDPRPSSGSWRKRAAYLAADAIALPLAVAAILLVAAAALVWKALAP